MEMQLHLMVVRKRSIAWPIVRKKSLISLRSAAFVTKCVCNLVHANMYITLNKKPFDYFVLRT